MLLQYQIVTVGVFIIFIFYVFDIRTKSGTAPLVGGVWTTLMKLIAATISIWFLYVVIFLNEVQWQHFVALGLIIVGTSSIIAAKVTLGRFHTWSGYHKIDTELVTKGIYSYIRHPLYTGGVLVEIAVAIVLFTEYRASRIEVLVAIAAAFGYMIPFNIILAERETQKMREKFGPVVDEYTSRVRAFIPIRKRA